MHIFRRLVKKKNSPLHLLMADAIYLVALVSPIMTIPQVIKIWGEKSASGVSLETWVAYTIVSFIWGIYGTLHKDKPLLLSQFLLTLVCGAVVVGVLLYR